MNNNKQDGGLLVEMIGMGVFFQVWIGLMILIKSVLHLLGASHDLANGVAIAVMLPIAGAVLLTGEIDRFNQIGLWVTRLSRNRE
ncbi:MAG: hypothetical protein HZB71_05425 [Betaproteobacteria bacterium]|nr:hypothetical protein [Betaproteobacteria bacterium]